MSQVKRGSLIIISGPSGAGKGTICAELMRQMPDLVMSCSATTRQPRANERKDPSYFREDLLSYGKDVILEIDVKGALQVKQNYPDSILFFIEAPSEQALYERLVKRGTESEEKIQIRMARNKLELAQRHMYDYCIMNDSVDRAVAEIIEILKSRRAQQ